MSKFEKISVAVNIVLGFIVANQFIGFKNLLFGVICFGVGYFVARKK
ncbi:MAG: hypothetical protein LBL93_04510 [Ruminococcus sp.]|nr:hypothetical protein [Ruminococcus sp.]